MAENRGCLGAFIALVVLAALGVVLLGVAAGGWFWYSNTAPPPGSANGPWTLTIDNPNVSPITVTCALESAAPTEIGAGEKATIEVTSLPVMCTGTAVSGVRVVDFTTTSPPADGRGWTTVATVEAGKAEPVAAVEPEPEPDVEPLKPGLVAAATKKPTKVAAPVEAPVEPAPAPRRTAPVIFRYPPGPKFTDIEVSVDGDTIGVRPNGATLAIGSHSVQFYKDGVVNISCPIEVLPEGRVVALNRKLTCPSPLGR